MRCPDCGVRPPEAGSGYEWLDWGNTMSWSRRVCSGCGRRWLVCLGPGQQAAIYLDLREVKDGAM